MSLLAHRIDGEGPPLLLLNGGLMSIAAWEAIALPLSRRFRVVRCDLRGQLLSPGPAVSIEGQARELRALLDHLSIARAHVVGTSFGGEVAMQFAADHPERVERLVVMTATDRITPEMAEATRRFEAAAAAALDGGDGGEVLRLLAPTAFSERYLASQPSDLVETRARQIAALPASFFEGVVGLMQALRGLDLSGALPRIEAPTLVIAAELDATFPLDHSRAIAAAIPNAELVVLEQTGHAAVVEAPERVVEEIVRFIGAGVVA